MEPVGGWKHGGRTALAVMETIAEAMRGRTAMIVCASPEEASAVVATHLAGVDCVTARVEGDIVIVARAALKEG